MVIKLGKYEVNAVACLFALCLSMLSLHELHAESGKFQPFVDVDYNKISKDYSTRRMDTYNKGVLEYEAAKKFLEQKEFKKALEKCDSAVKTLSKIGSSYVNNKIADIEEFKSKIKVAWVDHTWSVAKDYFDEEDYPRANATAQSILKIDSSQKEDVDKFSLKCNNAVKVATLHKQSDINAVDYGRETRKLKVSTLIAQGQQLLNKKYYLQARDKLERALIEDPINKTANFLLKRVYSKMYQDAQCRRDVEILEQMSDSAWRWVQAIAPKENFSVDPGEPQVGSYSNGSLYDKLQNIIIETIHFQDVDIASAARMLRNRSRTADSEKDGIDIIVSIDETEKQIPLINQKFTNIPMIEIIKYLCLVTGLNYQINDDVVMIGDKDLSPVISRTFTIKSDLYKSIIGVTVKDIEDTLISGDDTELIDEDFIDSVSEGQEENSNSSEESQDDVLKEYFEDCGIIFGKDASITYNSRQSQLIVTNTAEELAKLKNILDQINIDTPMVQMEAKMIEVKETDTFHLGFDWLFEFESSEGRWVMLDNSGASSIIGMDVGANPIVQELRLVPNIIDSTNIAMEVSIYGLENNHRSEVLNVPKLTVASGRKANSKFIQANFYPTSFNEPKVETIEGTTTIIPPEPQFEGDKGLETGVFFNIQPFVSTNNYTITANVNLETKVLSGFDIYDYQIVSRDTTYNFELKMPKTDLRGINTDIKIYDGEHIVIGGVVDESIDRKERKYPFLADIPFLGMLFKSQYQRKVKTNVLIFITARLYDYSGVPTRNVITRGIPDFNSK